ncbi:MAG: PAS domain-containing protein [bacterium]|nr:PAS domain-containing protein [bacterium]
MSDLIQKFQEKGVRQAESASNFVPESVRTGVASMSADELNALDFGVVRVDNQGKILFYNKYESELAGIAPAEAEGKNFFYDVAPCTNNRLFLGSFQQGVREGAMHILFFYTFTYRMNPTYVKVVLLKNKADENWIFVQKMGA